MTTSPTTAPPAERQAPRRSTMDRVALVWASLVVIIPVIFGVLMLMDDRMVAAPGVSAHSVMVAMAARNFAFSAVLALALVTQPRRTIAVLLFLRGLTEWADGLSGVFAVGPGIVAPWVGGLGDIAFAWFFYRREAA